MEERQQDRSLDDMWSEAAQSYHQTTGNVLQGKHPTVEEVLEKMRNDKDSQSVRATRRQSVRLVLDRITSLGDLAAAGASAAFPPSSLCFTAVSYLVETCWEYEKQRAVITDLFDAIAPFLECFDIYRTSHQLQNTADPGVMKLKRVIHERLQCFIWICSHFTKKSKEHRLKRLTKAAVRIDDGVSDKFDEIERLEKAEVRLLQALGFIELEEMRDILRRLERKREQEDMDQCLDTIKASLDIDGTKHNWHDTQTAIWNDTAESTGEWLFKRQDFRDWKNGGRASAPAVFALKADDGYGRSYLCAAVINHLLKQRPNDAGLKRLVAFYYFKKDERESSSMRNALRAILWQLSTNRTNKPFAKFFSRKCEQVEHLPSSKTHVLWKDSILEYLEKPEVKSQVFIVIDGIGHVSEDYDEFSQIVNDVSSFENGLSSIRFLLTGSKVDLKGLRRHFGTRIPMTELAVNEHNKSDLQLFVSSKIQEISRTWDRTSDSEKYQQLIERALLENTDGDYQNLNLTLKEISNARGKQDIDRILDPKRLRMPREETIRRQLVSMEKTLVEHEIDSLNEILPWIVLPKYDWPTMKQLKAVLFLKYKQNLLKSVEDLITERYAPLLEVDGTTVRSYHTMKYFKKENGSQQAQNPKETEPDTPASAQQDMISAAISPFLGKPSHDSNCQVHHLQVAMVQKFLLTVCDEKLYGDFGFKEFFEGLQRHPSKTIVFNRVDGHSKIILTCLKALCAEDDVKAEAEPLVDLAITRLSWHLSQIHSHELSYVDVSRRRTIGQLLVKLFRDRKCIEGWLTPERIEKIRHRWLYHPQQQHKSSLAGIALQWLKDPEVVAWIDPAERELVNTIIYGTKRLRDLFAEATNFVAEKWLLDQNWDVTQTFWWVLGYVQEKTESHESADGTVHKDVEKNRPSLNDISQAVSWAESKVDTRTSNLVSAVRLLDTLMRFEYYGKAIEEARSRDPNGWTKDWCIAREHHVSGNHFAVIESLGPVMHKFQANKNLQHGLGMPWKEIIYLYAEAREAEGDVQLALDAYQELLKSWPTHSETIGRAVHCMRRLARFSEIIRLLENHGDAARNSGGSLKMLFLDLAKSPSFHHDVNLAAGKEGRLELIKDAYEHAVEACPSGSEALFYLRHYYGLALWYQKDRDGKDTRKAFEIWEKNIFDKDIPQDSYIQRITSFKLASVYLQLARDNHFHQTPGGCIYVSKLEALVQRKSTDFQWTGSEEVLLARAYHLAKQGIKDKALADKLGRNARMLAAKHVGPALNILCDADPDNDWEGYTSLSNTLGHMDDDENALAAKSLIGPLQRDWMNPDIANDIAEIKYLRGRLKSSCDNCGYQWTDVSGMHICRDCIRTIFCADCVRRLKNPDDTIEHRVCDPSHQFLVVPKFKPVELDYVLVENELIKTGDWKENVRSKYGV
ncbi:neutral amino acid permease [Diplodia corticola]|uniref:Neutral amino acid permease n=1 Tax=Diplodia corticola TaxID=236234 RepID=A0A1J9SD67_9PEZI|nr:neutral amino acid permease [Diplodia corticola]OJD37796.1 neutral amino acid permease [Diplodia corticola]